MGEPARKFEKKDKKPDESRSAERVKAALNGLGAAKKMAKASFGNGGGAVFDPSSSPDISCRVGTYESVEIGRPTPKRRKSGGGPYVVRSLRVRGAGESWDEAFAEARRNREERR